jgi:molecular chaperone GrpE
MLSSIASSSSPCRRIVTTAAAPVRGGLTRSITLKESSYVGSVGATSRSAFLASTTPVTNYNHYSTTATSSGVLCHLRDNGNGKYDLFGHGRHCDRHAHASRRRWLSDATTTTTTTAKTAASPAPGPDVDPAEGAAEQPGQQEGQEQDLSEQVQLQLKEIDELKAEAQAMRDRLLRSLAEQENIRTIARRDVDDARQYSIKGFAKSLLDVADNLDRALEAHDSSSSSTATNNDGDGDDNTPLKALYEGISMTRSGLTKALESNGVKSYCHEPGDAFDPTLHEALMEYVDPTKPAGTIGLVMKKGYTLNGRVLRPAEVGVIKKV